MKSRKLGKLGKCEVGGQLQEQQNPEADMINQIAQMLQQGGDARDVVMSLLQQQLDPQQIAQMLIQAGLPQEQAVQSIQEVMQQAQQGQEQMQEPNQMGQEQPMMMFGGEFEKEFAKSLSDKLALPSSTTEDYSNERFKVFSEAVRRNFAKSVVSNNADFNPVKADDGIDLKNALGFMGVSEEDYHSNSDVKSKVDSFISDTNKEYEKAFSQNQNNYSVNNTNNQYRQGLGFSEGDRLGEDQQGFYVVRKDGSVQRLPGLIKDNWGSQNNNQYYNQGTKQVPFHGYADPRYAVPQMSPFGRLVESYLMRQRNPQLKNIHFENVPQNLDMASVIAGTHPMYSIQSTENFKRRAGLFRKEKGIRYNLMPRTTANPNGTTASSPTLGPGFQGYNADANGDSIPDFMSILSPNTQNVQSSINNLEIDRADIKMPAPPIVEPEIFENDNNHYNQNQSVNNESLLTRPFSKEQDLKNSFNLLIDESRVEEKSNTTNSNQAENLYKKLIQQESYNNNPYLLSLGEIIKDNPDLISGLDESTLDSIIKGYEPPVEGGYNVSTGKYESYPKSETLEEARLRLERYLRELKYLSRNVSIIKGKDIIQQGAKPLSLPEKMYGGNIYKAENGFDGSYVDFTYRKPPVFNPNDVADFSMNAANQMAYFMDMIRGMQESQNRSRAFYSSANESPMRFDNMSRGIYTDQGDFDPVNVGNQVLNPTNSFGDYSLNYLMANGGDVSFTPEEMEILKKAGYNLK